MYDCSTTMDRPTLERSSSSKKRRISSHACLNCRLKKIKCDRELVFPCTNCRKNNRNCTLSDDKRSKRPASDHTMKLEYQIKRDQEVIRKLYDATKQLSTVFHECTDLKLEDSNNNEVEEESNDNDSDPNDHRLITQNSYKYPRPSAFQNSYDTEPVSVYGPTSVFDCKPINSCAMPEQAERAEKLMQLNKDQVVIDSIKLFFNWLYPDIHMFIPREAFLLDFFHPREKDVSHSYCSVELVYAICALGCSLSSNISSRSLSFYNMSRSILMQSLGHPSLASMQSFILLGLYDIYNGRNNSGWILTGIGLRMGLNLGFQLNPKSWHLQNNESVNDLTVSIRSRIYWGCFIVDHLLALLLGRPAALQISDTTIQESQATPDIDWIHDYSFPGYSSIIDISNPLKSMVHLIVITGANLHKVFYESSPDKSGILLKSNREIVQWKSKLPNSLNWTNDSLEERAQDPTRMMHIYYYYIVQLCMNRPFIKTDSNSWETCRSAISDLSLAITGFTECHGYQKCSILMVYASIISVSTILLFTSKKTDSTHSFSLTLDPTMRRNFFTFMTVLKKCSKVWKLSLRSFDMISNKLKSDYNLSYENEYRQFVSENNKDNSIPTVSSTSSNETNIDVGIVQEDICSPSSRYGELLYNSFGGPPLFMNSDFSSSDWESLFPEYFGNRS